MTRTRSEAWQDAQRFRLFAKIRDQRRWIEEHGGDRAGYIERYGMPRSEGCHLPRWIDPDDGCQHPVHDKVYGDGGEAIYAADKGELDRLLAEYEALR